MNHLCEFNGAMGGLTNQNTMQIQELLLNLSEVFHSCEQHCYAGSLANLPLSEVERINRSMSIESFAHTKRMHIFISSLRSFRASHRPEDLLR